MDDATLLKIIETHRKNALGDSSSSLSVERAEAMDHYHGRPYGDEQEGRSQVVTKDLAETVDWIMPPIMKSLTQSGGVVEFDPAGEEDEAAALQETDYINHVLMKDNDGFLVIHDWVKDCLLLKNGYVKHFWDESVRTTEEERSGITIMELTQYQYDLEKEGAEFEVLEQSSEIIDGEELFEVRLRVTRKKGKICVEAVPTEEIRISKTARRGTQDATFIEHFTPKTRSDLIEMGMDKDWVNSLPANDEAETERNELARNSTQSEDDDENRTSDKSMDEIEYNEAYLRVDYDGDGKAELRKVITCGDKIPPGEEWNEVIDTIPITSVTSKRVPHRHIGESLDDDLADLQRIKTVLTRQMLDNIYITNNQEWVVNNRVHLPDFVESLPGMVKRVNDDLPVEGSVMAVPTKSIVAEILPAIDYINSVKDNRTGINKLSTDIDPDILKQSTKGAYAEAVSRASQKVEMIIRMIAETGVKELALRVHELSIKHQDKKRVIKLRGRYVPINPQEWKERTDMTVKVGLGTGTEEERRQRLSIITDLQAGLKEAGLVGPQQAYNLFDDLAEALGAENATRYAMDPQGDEYKALQQALAQQGPPPNPLAEVEKIKGEFAIEREQLKSQFQGALEQMKKDRESELEVMKIQVDDANKEAERVSRETIEEARLEIQAMIAGMKVDIGKPGLAAELARTFDPQTGTFI